MVWAPAGDERVVSERHDGSSISVSVGRKLLDRNLGLCRLEHATERHEDRRASDSRVEHLDKSLLGSHIRVLEIMEHLVLEGFTWNRALERILLLHSSYGSLSVMLRSGAVDELTREVHDKPVAVEHAHAASVGYVCDMGHLYVLAAAVRHHLLLVLCLDDDGHTLLRFADRKFRRVESAVLHRNPVEVYVKTVGKFSDGNADATGTEVVRFLDESGHFRTAEKPLELSLFRSITLLHLAAASLERFFGMFL